MKLFFARMCFVMSALLAIAACGEVFQTPVKREYTKTTVLVSWVEVADEATLNKACSRTGEDKKILACAVLHADTCTVYTYSNPTFDVLGHEWMHCFTGRWHA